MADAKVVLVTGAARRIGACIVETFHRHTYRVIVHYRQSAVAAKALVDTLNEQRPHSAACIGSDFNNNAEVEQLAGAALRCFGRLDVLVNNASSFYATNFGEVTQSQWDDLHNSNLRAAFFLAQSLGEEIASQRGAIVNVIDTHADRPLKNYPIYSIAKAGLQAITRSLAVELAPEVRVNGIAPGAILWPELLQDSEDPSVLEARERVLRNIPLGALGKKQDIADAVYFLANDADYVTGQVIRVDGGRSLA
ncbi:MAG TPA: pteridine reductase [Gammaproteobacteria bacterium]|jgi:pteridine reductase|nr:pteridine reductase [Gammaproteobacteria bacterium]MDP6731825.1 pteridine reductase [Gammaproteobacteria bacterium]HAJ76122.1 pteridine reductase [Gammaproteobacteria bacterium]|tara:strand:- start:2109 stop:2861 length:753 start_codon:yes stop_codon:yes gene_type:complete